MQLRKKRNLYSVALWAPLSYQNVKYKYSDVDYRSKCDFVWHHPVLKSWYLSDLCMFVIIVKPPACSQYLAHTFVQFYPSNVRSNYYVTCTPIKALQWCSLFFCIGTSLNATKDACDKKCRLQSIHQAQFCFLF